MNCESCQPNLLDLVYGELAPDMAEQSEAHLRECASCRSAFDKLQGGLRVARSLPRAAPPDEVGRQLLAIAEAKAAAVTTQSQRQAAPERGLFRPLIELVSRFAMARQVGMVTITVLIAVVGLVALPQLRPSSPAVQEVATPRAQAVRPATTAPEDKAGVRPADRLDLHVDSQARRIRSKDELARALPGQHNAPKGEAAAEPTAPAAASPEPAEAETAEQLERADDALSAERPAAPSQPAEPSSIASGVASAKSTDDLRDVGTVAARTPTANAEKKSAAPMPAAVPQPFPASASGGAAPALRGGVAARSAQRRSIGAANTETAQAASASTLREPSPLAGGRSAEEFAVPAAPSPGQPRRAQLAAARAIEARGNCSAARSAYERVIAAAPDSDEAGSALIALALCARQHGDDTTARSLLERASKIPTTSTRARSLLSAPAKAKSSRPATQPPSH
ncbi:MAG: hypothetical protein ACHQ53_02440 [Polyangiales bacterium]